MLPADARQTRIRPARHDARGGSLLFADPCSEFPRDYHLTVLFTLPSGSVCEPLLSVQLILML
jgi:hypothetical protein